MNDPQKLDLKCKNNQFFNGDSQITVETLSQVSCKRIQEPLIIRELKSDCSKGIGADGQINSEDNITLVKVGWQFSEKFHEQVPSSKSRNWGDF